MILGKYNQAKTVTFDLVAPDGVDLIVSATFASGDVVIMKDEGAEASTTNLPTDEGTGYSLVLTATEMSAARIRVYIIDQTGTKVWLDTSLGLETYGNASAEHAFDLDTASNNFDPAADAVANVTLTATATTLTNKTGFSLASTGLDAIVSTATGMIEIAKAIWDRVLTGATHNVNTSAGRRLRQVDAAFVIAVGTAQAGAAGTITLASGESSTDEIYTHDRIVIVGGTGVGEHGIITAYNGTTKVATMNQDWVIPPDNTSEYEIEPAAVVSVAVNDKTGYSISGTKQTLDDLNDITAVNARTEMDSNSTQLLAIVADSNELQADWMNGGRLDLLLDRLITEMDTARAEPAQGAPAASTKIGDKIDYLYKTWRNKVEQTATTLSIYNDAGTVVDHKVAVSDDGTTATTAEVATGP